MFMRELYFILFSIYFPVAIVDVVLNFQSKNLLFVLKGTQNIYGSGSGLGIATGTPNTCLISR